MIGEKITNPQRIIELAFEKKAVWVDWGVGFRIPAAVIQNWQLVQVMRVINKGNLYEYIKKEEEKIPFHKKLKIPLLVSNHDSFKGLTDKELCEW